MEELDEVLESAKKGGAPGADGVTYKILARVGLEGRRVLLDIFNRVKKEAARVHDWELSVIVPVPKAGCDPFDLDTFRGAFGAILELAREPLVVFVGYPSQLQPIQGDEHMRQFPLAEAMISVDLERRVYARTQEPYMVPFEFLHNADFLSVRSVDQTPVTCVGVQWRDGPNKGAALTRLL